MKPRLEIPADLQHLLEKREKEDRRAAKGAADAKAKKPGVERRKRNRRKP
jgi:hypothetical protein